MHLKDPLNGTPLVYLENGFNGHKLIQKEEFKNKLYLCIWDKIMHVTGLRK